MCGSLVPLKPTLVGAAEGATLPQIPFGPVTTKAAFPAAPYRFAEAVYRLLGIGWLADRFERAFCGAVRPFPVTRVLVDMSVGTGVPIERIWVKRPGSTARHGT